MKVCFKPGSRYAGALISDRRFRSSMSVSEYSDAFELGLAGLAGIKAMTVLLNGV